MLNQIINFCVIIFIPAFFTFLITPKVKRFAIKIKAVAKVTNRSAHSKPKPLLGGIAIYLGFIFSFVLFSEFVALNFNLSFFEIFTRLFDKNVYNNPTIFNAQSFSLILGASIILIGGIADDLTDITPKQKLLFQIVAASVTVFYGNLQFRDLTVFGVSLANYSFLFSFIWIIAITNMINLIDGLDGLAAGISIIFFGTITIIALNLDTPDYLTAMFALALLGPTLGFLFHNFYPAKIFMGDTGALFLGFMIANLSLLNFGFKKVTIFSIVVPLLLLMLPLLDTVLAIIRRRLNGKGIASADKDHMHHQFLKLNVNHRQTVLIFYLFAILFSIVGLLYSFSSIWLALIISVLLGILVLIFIEKTDVIARDFKPISQFFNKFKK